MKKKSVLMLVFITVIVFVFAISIKKNYIDKEKTNIDISENADELTNSEAESQNNNSNFEDENEDGYNNEEYEVPNFSDLSETEKFMNKGYITSMKVYLRVNQILNMSRDEIKKTKKEIVTFENEFSTLEGTEETDFAETILRELFASAYEAIDLYSRRLNGEEVKSIMIYDKISKSQEKYLAYAEEFDNKKTPMSREIIEEVIEIREEINHKLKNVENHE